jgi:hypothetical protein
MGVVIDGKHPGRVRALITPPEKNVASHEERS